MVFMKLRLVVFDFFPIKECGYGPMGVISRVGEKALDGFCPEVYRAQFLVIGCVQNYFFVSFIVFDKSECDGNVVNKVKEIVFI